MEQVQQSKSDNARPPDELSVKMRRIETAAALFGSFSLAMAGHIAKMDTGEPGYGEGAENKLVNNVHEFPDGKSLRNLGVIHTNSQFKMNEGFFRRAVKDSEVLLIEDHTGPFFEQFADLAIQENKKIMDIDVYNKPLHELCESGLLIGGLSLVIEQAYAEWKRKKKDIPMQLFHTRRNILRAICGAGIAASVFQGLDNPFANATESSQSFMTRGRTATMLDESQKIIQTGHEKKYLLVTGNGHAQIIEDYFANPQILDNDLEKYKMQFATFGRGNELVNTAKD